MFGPSAPRTVRYTDASYPRCSATCLGVGLMPACCIRDQARADSAALRNTRPLNPMPALREAALYTFSNTRGTPSR